ncbi:ATP-binding cassette domain-containing protein, partial [Leptospira weilii]
GFVRPDSGKVFIDGQDVTDSPMHIRARLGVGYLAQEASIFRKLTVAENLEAILETMNLSRTEIIKRRDDL